jgi:BolA protein
MSVQQAIAARLTAAFPGDRVDVVNESHAHRGPGAETHFHVTIVSDRFAGERPVARHRRVHALLAEELAGPVHALAIHAYTAAEWERQVARHGGAPQSPACAHAPSA